MVFQCSDCGTNIDFIDAVLCEIVSCPTCGIDYVVISDGNGIALRELVIDGEDWGET